VHGGERAQRGFLAGLGHHGAASGQQGKGRFSPRTGPACQPEEHLGHASPRPPRVGARQHRKGVCVRVSARRRIVCASWYLCRLTSGIESVDACGLFSPTVRTRGETPGMRALRFWLLPSRGAETHCKRAAAPESDRGPLVAPLERERERQSLCTPRASLYTFYSSSNKGMEWDVWRMVQLTCDV
jgi:hypothetical protein